MDSSSVVLKLRAALADGWTEAFSKAGKDVSGLSRSMEELKAIGGKAFSFNDFNMKSENLKQAEKALDAFKKKLGDKTPTQQQERELNRLKKNVEDAGTKFDKAKGKVDAWIPRTGSARRSSSNAARKPSPEKTQLLRIP